MAILQRSKRLKKELGLLGVYTIATGATLSTGFFLLPGLAALSAGPAVPLAYLIAAVPMIPAMLSMVELATAMPRAGGAYYFLDRSMGPLVGTLGGLGTWLALSLKTTFALIGMGAYLHLVLPGASELPLAIAFTFVFGAVNLWGARGAGSLQSVLVFGLLAILIWFMGGIVHVDPGRFSGLFQKGPHSILAAAGLVYVSYIGITKVASVSEEIRNPERNLPLGVFLALATALVIYIVGTVVMVGVLPMNELAGDLTPVASTAQRLVGRGGTILIIIAALFAFSSVANAGILSASRYPLALSRDHLIPRFFRRLSPRRTPVAGVIATVVLMLVFLLVLDPMRVAELASAFQLLLFALICVAVVVMRESRIDSYDPGFRSPGYPWMQIVGVLAAILLIIEMGWLPVLFTAGFVAVGIVWYFRYARKRVHRDGAVYHVFERLGHRRYAELDSELRGILKEKGLRAEDPFDEVVARAQVFEAAASDDFTAIARRAAGLFCARLSADADHVFQGFMRGTKIGATPVSHGAALPHVRLPGALHPELVMVRCREGLDLRIVDEFGDERPQEAPVRAIFFLVSPEENPGQHLRLLAQIAGRVDDDDFMRQWEQARDEQEMKEILLRDERYLALHLQASGGTASFVDRRVSELEIPRGCLIAIVRRGDLTFVPGGDTVLEAGDRLTVIGEPEGIRSLRERFGP
jgi:APA family basic amino acid/polyamine antiporter